QSPFGFSRSVRPRCPTRVKRAVTSSTGSPRCSAMAASSAELTQTKPGSPVQQCPQRVHVNRRPSAYQGFAMTHSKGNPQCKQGRIPRLCVGLVWLISARWLTTSLQCPSVFSISSPSYSQGLQDVSSSRYLFTSESVSMGHPDKVADQISDAVLDFCLKHDPLSRVACETLVTTDLAVVAGEVTTGAPLTRQNIDTLVRGAVTEIGYTDPTIGFAASTCQVNCQIHAQSRDIAPGIAVGGGGDQGMMFGFACDETHSLMPLPIYLAHRLVERHAELRRKDELVYLRPDAKSQVTVEYNDDGTPHRVHTVVFSTQHDERAVESKDGKKRFSKAAREELIHKLILPTIKAERPDLVNGDIEFHINPTGLF